MGIISEGLIGHVCPGSSLIGMLEGRGAIFLGLVLLVKKEFFSAPQTTMPLVTESRI